MIIDSMEHINTIQVHVSTFYFLDVRFLNVVNLHDVRLNEWYVFSVGSVTSHPAQTTPAFLA